MEQRACAQKAEQKQEPISLGVEGWRRILLRLLHIRHAYHVQYHAHANQLCACMIHRHRLHLHYGGGRNHHHHQHQQRWQRLGPD